MLGKERISAAQYEVYAILTIVHNYGKDIFFSELHFLVELHSALTIEENRKTYPQKYNDLNKNDGNNTETNY